MPLKVKISRICLSPGPFCSAFSHSFASFVHCIFVRHFPTHLNSVRRHKLNMSFCCCCFIFVSRYSEYVPCTISASDSIEMTRRGKKMSRVKRDFEAESSSSREKKQQQAQQQQKTHLNVILAWICIYFVCLIQKKTKVNEKTNREQRQIPSENTMRTKRRVSLVNSV